MSTLYVVLPITETGIPDVRTYSVISKTEKTWKVRRAGGEFTVNPKTHNARTLCTENPDEAFQHLHNLLQEEREKHDRMVKACTDMIDKYHHVDILPTPVC